MNSEIHAIARELQNRATWQLLEPIDYSLIVWLNLSSYKRWCYWLVSAW